MKLLRYGPKGQEKPGRLDADGNIRDLFGAVPDPLGTVLNDVIELGIEKLGIQRQNVEAAT